MKKYQDSSSWLTGKRKQTVAVTKLLHLKSNSLAWTEQNRYFSDEDWRNQIKMVNFTIATKQLKASEDLVAQESDKNRN